MASIWRATEGMKKADEEEEEFEKEELKEIMIGQRIKVAARTRDSAAISAFKILNGSINIRDFLMSFFLTSTPIPAKHPSNFLAISSFPISVLICCHSLSFRQPAEMAKCMDGSNAPSGAGMDWEKVGLNAEPERRIWRLKSPDKFDFID
jgi:hypothetical protein